MRGLLGVWRGKLSPARLKTSRGRKRRAFWSAYNQHLLASWSSVCYIVTYRVGKLFFKANQESHLINKKEYFRVFKFEKRNKHTTSSQSSPTDFRETQVNVINVS